MNIPPSAKSINRATISAQRTEVINLIRKAADEGRFDLHVQDVHPSILQELEAYGYDIQVFHGFANHRLIDWSKADE